MQSVVGTTGKEKALSQKLNKIDGLMLSLRDQVRNGEVIDDIDLKI